ERQALLNHQVTADREEEERRQLADQVVEEFGEKLALIDLASAVVDDAHDMGEMAELQLHRIVGLDLGETGGALLALVGDDPYGAHAAFLQLVRDALQLR